MNTVTLLLLIYYSGFAASFFIAYQSMEKHHRNPFYAALFSWLFVVLWLISRL